jgi:heat shock protein HslJ
LREVVGDSGIDLQFNNEESKIYGNAGCNRYFSSYSVNGDGLSFSPIGSTMMACEEQLMKQEAEYLKILEAVKTFVVDEKELKLKTSNDGILIFAGQ